MGKYEKVRFDHVFLITFNIFWFLGNISFVQSEEKCFNDKKQNVLTSAKVFKRMII